MLLLLVEQRKGAALFVYGNVKCEKIAASRLVCEPKTFSNTHLHRLCVQTPTCSFLLPHEQELLDEHRVAERQKTVTLANGMLIRRHDVLATSQCAYQHHQRRARYVKVRDHRINHIKRITR